ncbi:MAG: efflux RND transporter periplasmic adaptor subunit [Gammaproteobacteria bacterium]|jgi:RND family efflux transporter MFP subunit|nr:efflux RND transporter periplasmic adaptor subunit [Gammaproteobacteria bacterium]NBD95434.1 efflux RND transporter periplasmic adaptor subunit [Gammaproteobacteria bacterium]
MKRLFAHGLLTTALVLGLIAEASGQTPVSVVRPQTGESAETLRFTGNLTARQVAGLSSQESGLIAAMHVDAGDTVESDQVLVELDSGLAEQDVARATAARDEARAALDEARRLAEEARRLGNDRFFPETELRARESGVVLAEARLARAESELSRERERLDRHRLRAPFDGVIGQRHVERGEWIEPGTAVVELVKVDELWLDVRVPQRYWADLGRMDGVTVRAWPDVDPDRELDTRVQARVPVSDPTARTFLLRLLVNDDSGIITPGMSARVELVLERDEATIRVPRDAILRYPDGTTTVWVVEAGSDQAHEHAVDVRRNVGDMAELSDELPADARVVTRGNEILSEGETVRIVEDEG